jgi:CBS domain-containing protein
MARRRRTNRFGARSSIKSEIAQREAKMASKRQSSGNIRQAHQKKAELAKASKEELRHMEGRTAAKSAQQKAKEADLGQKEARLEKISKEELSHMESGDAAAAARKGRSAMKVQMAMHKGVEWVSPDTPVAEIARLMRKHDIGAIPIGKNDRLIGMVTDRDIVCKGLAKNGFDASRATARDVMTPGIHCCRESDDLAKAVQHMEQLQVRRLPVINANKRMVGMLSLGDLSQAAPTDVLSECVRSVAAHHS